MLFNLFQSDGSEPGKARLVTIRYSHYCDRARWALDFTPLQYTEDSHPPGFQQFATLPLTDGKVSATPVLQLPDGTVIDNSATIVKHLVRMFPNELGSLYPVGFSDEIDRLEAEMEVAIGAYARQVSGNAASDMSCLLLPLGSSSFTALLHTLQLTPTPYTRLRQARCKFAL